MKNKQLETMCVYFDLFGATNDNYDEELRALKQLDEMFLSYMVSPCGRVYNEGHASFGNLVCYFVAFNNKEWLQRLQEYIDQEHVTGDDEIHLNNGFTASNFCLVLEAGLSKPIPFEDWDTYIETLPEGVTINPK